MGDLLGLGEALKAKATKRKTKNEKQELECFGEVARTPAVAVGVLDSIGEDPARNLRLPTAGAISAHPMTRFLTLRSPALSRFVAATFVAMYAVFASGAAFGALDLACLKLPASPCSPAPGVKQNSCGCGHAPDAGERCCCCCSKEEGPAPETGFSFTAAARCANPDSGSTDGLTRVSPHVSADEAGVSSVQLALAFTLVALRLPSHPSAPPDKVPLAL